MLFGLIAAIVVIASLRWAGRAGPKKVSRVVRQGRKLTGLAGGVGTSLIARRYPLVGLAIGLWTRARSSPADASPSPDAASLTGLSLGELLVLRQMAVRQHVVGGTGTAGRIEAELDRRFPGWREHAHGDSDPGRRPDSERDPMSEQEAHEILGLQHGADAAAIREAHRALIKRLHPDQGGSTYLASRVNQAKDLLLDRHR